MDRPENGDASTGIPGLDDVLCGGFERSRTYLIEGSPGTGKTTLALQFLRTGVEAGERCLYLTLAESADELRASARSHGWQLDGVEICEVVTPESLLDDQQRQSLLYSSDLELGETTQRIFTFFEQFQPDRVVIDSLSEIRLLAQSSLRYRRQILALKHYFVRRSATVLMLDDLTSEATDKTVHSLAHGVLRLEELSPEYGAERRRMRVIKYRGRGYRGGFHDAAIHPGGLRIYPRLVSAEHRRRFDRAVVPTASAELNDLLGGGIERGSSVLVLGPAGTGKSLLTLLFIRDAVARGEKAALFVFDEETGLLVERAKGLGIDLQLKIDREDLLLVKVDAAELSPGEFAHRVRHCVEHAGVRTVVIDSINGYQAAMPGEHALVLHTHELLQYLSRQGVVTFLTVAQHGLFGSMSSPVDVTFLADTVILLRYFEAVGHIRRAISVVKKRTGDHEQTIREYRIGSQGIILGAPITAFQGVLTGVPVLAADSELLDQAAT